MYGEIFGKPYLACLQLDRSTFILIILAFEELHDDIKFVITKCTQQKSFKENQGSGERECTIAGSIYLPSLLSSRFFIIWDTTKLVSHGQTLLCRVLID